MVNDRVVGILSYITPTILPKLISLLALRFLSLRVCTQSCDSGNRWRAIKASCRHSGCVGQWLRR